MTTYWDRLERECLVVRILTSSPKWEREQIKDLPIEQLKLMLKVISGE